MPLSLSKGLGELTIALHPRAVRKIPNSNTQWRWLAALLEAMIFSIADKTLGKLFARFTGMQFTGTLKTWHDDRGFGFIEPTSGGQEIFVHIKAFPSGTGRPSVGQQLVFEVGSGKNGKKSAHSVQYPVRGRAGNKIRLESPAEWTLLRTLVIPCFVGVYALVAWRWGFVPYVLLTYLT